MQPIIDALQEIISDIDQLDLSPVDRLSASLLLSSLIYLLQSREDALNHAKRNTEASQVQRETS